MMTRDVRDSDTSALTAANLSLASYTAKIARVNIYSRIVTLVSG